MVSLTLLIQSAIADWILKQLHCPNFTNEGSTLLNTVSANENILSSSDATIVKLLLCDDKSLDLESNTLVLNASVDFVLSSKRFDGPLI